MGKICDCAVKIEDDLYMCNKYNAYCYIDEPDKKKCLELYGTDNEEDTIKEEEASNEDSI